MGDNDQKSGIGDNNFGGKAIVSFTADSLILKEGEVNLDMYKIIQGRAEMYMGYGTDNEVLLGIIGPGACFGELGLLLQAPSIYTIIAYSDVYAIRVTPDRMGNFIEQNQTTILQIMKDMARTMAVMQHQIVSLSEEISSYTHEETKPEDVTKELLKSYYTPGGVGMKGKMYFMGSHGSDKK